MIWTITLFYAGVLALLLLVLSARVAMVRRRLQVGLGTGGERELQLAVRAHANFCEYVPLALLLLLLLELSAAFPPWVLHLLGIVLVVARVGHGMFGLNRSPGASLGRFWGTLVTWLVIAASALLGAGLAIGGWLSNI